MPFGDWVRKTIQNYKDKDLIDDKFKELKKDLRQLSMDMANSRKNKSLTCHAVFKYRDRFNTIYDSVKGLNSNLQSHMMESIKKFIKANGRYINYVEDSSGRSSESSLRQQFNKHVTTQQTHEVTSELKDVAMEQGIDFDNYVHASTSSQTVYVTNEVTRNSTESTTKLKETATNEMRGIRPRKSSIGQQSKNVDVNKNTALNRLNSGIEGNYRREQEQLNKPQQLESSGRIQSQVARGGQDYSLNNQTPGSDQIEETEKTESTSYQKRYSFTDVKSKYEDKWPEKGRSPGGNVKSIAKGSKLTETHDYVSHNSSKRYYQNSIASGNSTANDSKEIKQYAMYQNSGRPYHKNIISEKNHGNTFHQNDKTERDTSSCEVEKECEGLMEYDDIDSEGGQSYENTNLSQYKSAKSWEEYERRQMLLGPVIASDREQTTKTSETEYEQQQETFKDVIESCGTHMQLETSRSPLECWTQRNCEKGERYLTMENGKMGYRQYPRVKPQSQPRSYEGNHSNSEHYKPLNHHHVQEPEPPKTTQLQYHHYNSLQPPEPEIEVAEEAKEVVQDEPLKILDVHQYFTNDYDPNTLNDFDVLTQIETVKTWASTYEDQVQQVCQDTDFMKYFVLDEKLMRLIEHLDKLKCQENQVATEKKIEVIQYIKNLHTILDKPKN